METKPPYFWRQFCKKCVFHHCRRVLQLPDILRFYWIWKNRAHVLRYLDIPVEESPIIPHSKFRRQTQEKCSYQESHIKRAKLALEARNNNTSDDDSDLSNFFSDCSISEDEDKNVNGAKLECRKKKRKSWINFLKIVKNCCVSFCFLLSFSIDL